MNNIVVANYVAIVQGLFIMYECTCIIL